MRISKNWVNLVKRAVSYSKKLFSSPIRFSFINSENPLYFPSKKWVPSSDIKQEDMTLRIWLLDFFWAGFGHNSGDLRGGAKTILDIFADTLKLHHHGFRVHRTNFLLCTKAFWMIIYAILNYIMDTNWCVWQISDDGWLVSYI